MSQVKFAPGGKWLDPLPGPVAKWLHGLPLTQHLLLVALTPLFLVLAVLLGLSLAGNTRAREDLAHERGLSIVRLLAPAAELGVAFRNPQQLDHLLATVLEQDDVAVVAIYDHAGAVIVNGGRATVPLPVPLVNIANPRFIGERDGRLSFAAPVVVGPAVLDDIAQVSMQAEAPVASNTLGWVYVELDTHYRGAYGEKSGLAFLSVAAATLLVSAGVALRLAHRVGDPVARLADAVTRMAAGDVEASVPVDAISQELQALQDGFNALGRSIVDVRNTMQARIEERTCQFAYQALHDPLTGLSNRRAFDLALEDAFLASLRASDHGALCFIDLDHFKVVNDAGGHAAGDALLREVAGLIQQRVRAQDLVCRIGGDEFALVLHGCTGADARRIAKSLCEAIAAFRFDWEGQGFAVSGSFGMAYIDGSTTSKVELLKAADVACYAAKHRGGNQVVDREMRSM